MFAPRGNTVLSIVLFFSLSFVVNFPEGYTNSYPNTAVESFKDFYNNSFTERGIEFTENRFSWVWAGTLNIWFVGYLLGEFITPPLTENYGRKKALMFSSFLALIGATLNLLSTLINWPELFVAGRLFSSISSGLSFGVLILFLQEAPPTKIRGSVSSLSETAFLFSTVLGMLWGMDMFWGKNLPIITGIPLIPAILTLVLVIPLKETPKYLLLHENDVDGAREAIKYYHGKANVDKVLKDIALEPEDKTHVGGFQQIFSLVREPHVRSAFIIGILTLQLVVSFWPITQLSTIILENILTPEMAQLASVLYIASNFLTSLIGIWLVEQVGRRSLVLILGFINVLSLIMFIICDTVEQSDLSRQGIIAALIIFGASSGLGLASIAFFLPSELVSQRRRSLVQSATYSINTIMNLVFSGATLPLYEIMGSYCFLPLFIIPGFLSLIYLYLYLPETKGREIHDIVSEMMRNGRSHLNDSSDSKELELLKKPEEDCEK